ncbi:hypothetical protein V500_00836, partial [Pseudogymnoascus sp. VKM F-4518 (FW-2643)]
CSHIASFTYEITELLKTEILDFDRFRSDILTPDSHVDQAKDLYDGRRPAMHKVRKRGGEQVEVEYGPAHTFPGGPGRSPP